MSDILVLAPTEDADDYRSDQSSNDSYGGNVRHAGDSLCVRQAPFEILLEMAEEIELYSASPYTMYETQGCCIGRHAGMAVPDCSAELNYDPLPRSCAMGKDLPTSVLHG